MLDPTPLNTGSDLIGVDEVVSRLNQFPCFPRRVDDTSLGTSEVGGNHLFSDAAVLVDGLDRQLSSTPLAIAPMTFPPLATVDDDSCLAASVPPPTLMDNLATEEGSYIILAAASSPEAPLEEPLLMPLATCPTTPLAALSGASSELHSSTEVGPQCHTLAAYSEPLVSHGEGPTTCPVRSSTCTSRSSSCVQ